MNYKILFVLPLLLAGCIKENQHPVDIYWGTTTMEFNGEIRDFMPFCDTDGLYLNIVMDYYNTAGKLEYHLNLGHIQKQVYITDSLAVYSNIPTNTSEWTNLVSFMSDGDVVGNVYMPLQTENNVVEITDWNPLNLEVKGKLQITYVIDPLWPVNDPTAPDTIRIVNGVFYTRV